MKLIPLLFLGGVAFYACNSDPFPVGEEFTAGFQVPFVTTHTFNFKTGSGDISGIQGNLRIISGADVQNLVTAAPGNLVQSQENGVISGTVVDGLGSPVSNVLIGGIDAAGNILKDEEGNTLIGVTNSAGDIVAPLLFNSISGTPEFINTEGTAASGSFTVFNAPPGELFIKAIRGGRGNGRVTAFAGGVSLANMEVFTVPIPTVILSGVVNELDGTTRVSQAEIAVPGLSGILTSSNTGAFRGSGFGSDSRFLLKVTAADHHDTYQETTTNLGRLQAGTASTEVIQDLRSVSIREGRSLAAEAGITLDPGKGILIGRIVEFGTRKGGGIVRATNRLGGEVGDITYFDAGTDRPDPALATTSTNGRFMILNLPPGDLFLTAHATVASIGGSGVVKSAGSAIVPIFPNGISLKTISVTPIERVGLSEPPFTIALSGTVTEEDQSTPVGNATINILGVTTPPPGNPGPTAADGLYSIAKGTDLDDDVPLLANSRYIVQVDESVDHVATFQTIGTGRQDMVRDLVAVSKTLVSPTGGTGAILGRVLNRSPDGAVGEVVIEVTQMRIDGQGLPITTGQPVGQIDYFNGGAIDPNLSTTTANGRFLISNLLPGLVMIKAVSSDDSGNLQVRTFQGGVTLADITINHTPLTVSVSGKMTNLGDTPVPDVSVSVLGAKGTFASGDFTTGVSLAANSQFLLKATKAGFIDTYNFQLKTKLTGRPNQRLFISSMTETSDLAGKGNVIFDNTKGMVAGKVVEASFNPDPNGPISLGSAPHAVATGLFDEDNLLDLAVVRSPGLVSILLGRKDGGFDGTTLPPIQVGTDPRSITVGDFDRDGRLDLAVADLGSDSVSTRFGLGNGRFIERFGAISDGVGLAPQFITTNDIDGDGNLDLAVANSISNDLSILLGDGNGGFSSQDSPCPIPCPVGNTPGAIASGDFDGDGLLDQAIANFGSDTVSLLLSRNIPGTLQVGSQPNAIAVGDLDGDGNLDLTVANAGSDTVTSFLGDGLGGFTKTDCLPETAAVIEDCPLEAGSAPRAMTFIDFDQDGRLDLALANEASGKVSLLLGLGNGRFNTASRLFPVGPGPSSLVAGDFNQDGRADLAVANTASVTLSLLLSFSSPADGVVVEVRDEGGSPVGTVRYLNETNDDVKNSVTGQVLDKTTTGGRFIAFNVPVGLAMIKAVPEVSTRPFSGNALVTVFQPETLSFADLFVSPGSSSSVGVRGITCRPLGTICTRVGNAGISLLGTRNDEICVSDPNCLSGRLDGNYSLSLDPNSTYVIKLIGPEAALPGDSDGDGVLDASDNCPNIVNPDQADANGNRIGDACEFITVDDDGDGIPNEVDNCPFTPNPEQADSDGDGIGDQCDQTPNG